MRRILTLHCLLLIASLSPARAWSDQAEARKFEELIRSRMESIRQETGVPGISVGFQLADGSTGAAAVGTADAEQKEPLTAEHLILSGSIGKTFAATAILRLVDQGKLDLDAPISRYLGKEPWFERLPNAKTITLRQLMRHQSGIREHVETPKFVDALLKEPDRVWKPAEIIAFALDQEPLFEAGKGWSYADTNYIVAGIIYEKVTGRTIFGDIEQSILKPLKLTRIRPSDRREIPRLAVGFSMPNSPFRITGPVIKDGKLFSNPQMEWTGGGFASTPTELARWAKALYGGDVLPAAVKTAMLEGVPARTGRGDKYGLGVQIRESPWGVSYGHGGWFPGYLSEMEYFPDHKVAIAVQITTDDMRKLGRRPRALVAEVARIILGEPKASKPSG